MASIKKQIQSTKNINIVTIKIRLLGTLMYQFQSLTSLLLFPFLIQNQPHYLSCLMKVCELGFPDILKNLENNKFIFQVLEMSLNFTNQEMYWKCHGINIACEKIICL